MRSPNPFWHQLPVYSPVTLGSILAGILGEAGIGRPLDRLRSLLLSEYGCRDLVLTDSGTSALRLAIEVSTKESGSTVVGLPAYSCFDVATAAVGAGAHIALYDICPETLGPDFDSLRRAIEIGARTVVVAHLYGIPVDLERSRAICAEAGVLLIEDSAQGAGGSWNGRPLATHGSLGVLSFGRGKGRTGGSGGALLGNDEWGERLLKSLHRPHSGGRRGYFELAKLAAQWLFGRPSLYGIPVSLPWFGLGETAYKEPWTPKRMSRGAAAALLANWEASKVEEQRRKTWDPLNEETWGDVRLAGRLPAEATPSWLRYPVLAERTEALDLSLARKIGLVRGYPASLASLPSVAELRVEKGQHMGARYLASSLFTLPMHRFVRHPS